MRKKPISCNVDRLPIIDFHFSGNLILAEYQITIMAICVMQFDRSVEVVISYLNSLGPRETSDEQIRVVLFTGKRAIVETCVTLNVESLKAPLLSVPMYSVTVTVE